MTSQTNTLSQISYGSNETRNRVRPGGTLGSNQYYYTIDAKNGEITVNKYVKDGTDSVVASIPKGSNTISINSNTSSDETSFFSTPSNIANVRKQSLQIAQREWNGKTQPPPTQAIYGTNSINAAYDPPGSSTVANSLKNNTRSASGNAANAALSEGLNALTSGGDLEDIANAAFGGAMNSIFGKKGKSSGGAIVYPVAIRQTGQDYISIQKLEWGGKTRKGLKWGDRSPSSSRNLGPAVILPIPGGIQSTDAVSWGQDKMGPMETAMANVALAGIGEGFGAAGEELQNISGQVTGGKAEIKDALKKAIAGAASGTGAQLMTRTTGQVVNPNMELLFKDPQLRQFSFSWKLAPRSRDEAKNVISIIRLFKEGMVPTKSPSNLFLKSPSTWKLAYKHRGNNDHKYLNKFKECAMLNFTANYTPDGNYATFEDGVMTAYQITMSFQELEPVFSNDYKGLNGIGY